MTFIETFFYVAPNMHCHKCWAVIPLPCPDLPQTNHDLWCGQEYKSPTESVPDGWNLLFGCRECGHIEIRVEDHIGHWLVEKETQGKFQNETHCFSVKLQCAKIDCKAPATLHVNLKDGEGANDLLRLLKTNFFGGPLPCGHQIMPVPDRYYVDPHRVLNSLW
jgi:hypothetical protein